MKRRIFDEPLQVRVATMSARVPPLSDMVNALDYEASAKARLDPSLFALIAGGDRRALERITFRPRMMVNTTGLDLTSELLGAKLFAPILVGPMANLKRFHPEGEVAMARGASAAKAAFVVSSECSVPVGEVAAVATSPWWYQVYADASPAASKDKIDQAAEAGAKALVITAIRVAKDWPAVSALRKGVKMPGIPVLKECHDSCRGQGRGESRRPGDCCFASRQTAVGNWIGVTDGNAGGGSRYRSWADPGSDRRWIPARRRRLEGLGDRRKRRTLGSSSSLGAERLWLGGRSEFTGDNSD